MKNLPHKNFFGNPMLEGYSDDVPSRDNLQTLQNHINHILEAIE
jgi:hypothetical protein